MCLKLRLVSATFGGNQLWALSFQALIGNLSQSCGVCQKFHRARMAQGNIGVLSSEETLPNVASEDSPSAADREREAMAANLNVTQYEELRMTTAVVKEEADVTKEAMRKKS